MITFQDLKAKIETMLQKKGLQDYQVRIEFMYYTEGKIKPKISIRKRKEPLGKVTHDLTID